MDVLCILGGFGSTTCYYIYWEINIHHTKQKHRVSQKIMMELSLLQVRNTVGIRY